VSDRVLTQPQIHPLQPGFTLIHYYRPSPVVVADVWVRAGSAMETPDQGGMAHLLEHMIFKGSANLQPGDFDRLVENQGGLTNAATSYDYAHFFITTAVNQLPAALPALGELLLGASLPAPELERERQVVLEELRQAQDNPDWVAYQHLLQGLYGSHPYGRSILGSPQHLQTHTVEALRQFHQRQYQPANLTVVVAGGLDLDPCRALVERSFCHFSPPPPAPPLPPVPRPQPSADTSIAPHRIALQLPYVEQTRLLLGWSGPGVDRRREDGQNPEMETPGGNLREILALELWAMVLATGRSSPWVQILREDRQWIHSISTNFLLQQQASLFSVSIWLDTDQLDRVEAWIVDNLCHWQTHLLDGDSLQRAKGLLRNDYIFATETHGQLAGLYGYYNTIADLNWAVTYFEVLAQVQSEDLRQVMERYLRPQAYTAVMVRAQP